MAIRNIFSKRTAPAKSAPDVLVYDKLPQPLRVQIVHIWRGALGQADDVDRYSMQQPFSAVIWNRIVQDLARELGIFQLADKHNDFEAAGHFLLNPATAVKNCLDLIELSFQAIDTEVRKGWYQPERRYAGISQEPDEAIAELNHRLLEHAVGYQFENGHLVRLDSSFTHAQIIKPALALLSDKRFKNAESEFLAAHRAYREQRTKDCLNECLKAFESTMKIICSARKWPYQPGDTASKLISIVLDNGLLPSSLQTQLTGLRTTLESGTPTVRNKMGGHGQGPVAVVVGDHLARFALNTSAANIVLMVEAFNALP